MASIRLNKDLREIIKHRLVNHRFGKEAREMTQQWAFLAKDIHTAAHASWARLIKLLPDEALQPQTDIKMIFMRDMKPVTLPFSGMVSINMRRSDLVSILGEPNGAVLVQSFSFLRKKPVKIVKGSAYERRFEELVQWEAKLSESYSEVSRNLSIIDRANTVGGLLGLWPTLAPFCEDMAPRKVQLPAINQKELDVQFKLPVT